MILQILVSLKLVSMLMGLHEGKVLDKARFSVDE